MNAAPILLYCVLARHHKGGCDEDLIRAVRESRRCGKVVRMIEVEERLDPAGSPEEYRQREEDDVQETAERDGVDDTTAFGYMVAAGGEEPLRADPAEKEAERLENDGLFAPQRALALIDIDAKIGEAILRVVDTSVAGLSITGILQSFPPATWAAVETAVMRATDSGRLSRYMSDDDPPVPVYVIPGSPTSQASLLSLSPQGADPEPQAPTAADLTARVVAAEHLVSVDEKHLWDLTHDLDRHRAERDRAIDAKARAMHAAGTPLVTIGGITYRPKAPRKKRGAEADVGALWGLERVEVGE